MKKYFYILLLALFTASCNTIEKMVEKGQYDEAFAYSVKQVAGKKTKKTKYVTALEDAYVKLNKRDADEISFLIDKGSQASWDRVLVLYNKLDYRQSLVSPLSPLVSEDGYIAHFEFKDYSKEKLAVIKLSADYHYSKAMEQMEEARLGDKRAARRALTSLNDLNKYYTDYQDAAALRREAIELGTEHIAVEFVTQGNRYFDVQAMDRIQGFDVTSFNTTWEKFHRYDGISTYDNYIVIEIDNIDLGMEREYVNHNNFRKEIEDGYDIIEETITTTNKPVEAIKKDGPKANDTRVDFVSADKNKPVKTTVVTKKIKYTVVNAEIIEIKRERLSNMYGKVKVYNSQSDIPVYTNVINVNFDFYDEAVRLKGDKRALPQNMYTRLDDYINDFPNDYAVVDQLAIHFRRAITNEINKYDFLYN